MQMAQANVVKDTGRVVAGVVVGGAAGAAASATVNTIFNLGSSFIKSGKFVLGEIDDVNMRLFGVLGAAAGFTTGLATTTYGRVLRAQCTLWAETNKNLITITMGYYETDAELVNALEQYYLAHPYPLVSAKRGLSQTLCGLTRAASLITAALEDISDDSSRAAELNEWLNDIYTKRAYVIHAASVIERDPRLISLLNEQAKLDLVAAQQSLANAHHANAAAGFAQAAAIAYRK
jgi:hypothetical protein